VHAYRKAVAARFAGAGFSVFEAGTAAEAEAAAESGAFEIAIIDNHLPDATGVDLVGRLSRHSGSTLFFLVVEPAFAMADPELFCHERGIDAVLKGPMSPDALCSKVQRGIEQGVTMSDFEAPRRRVSAPASMPEKDRGFEDPAAQLMEVRQSYQRKIPGELARLRARIDEHKAAGVAGRAITEAHAIAHTLHGTAGTLGFTEVSEVAGQVELKLKALLSGRPLDQADWLEIASLLEKAMTAPERTSLLSNLPAGPHQRMAGIGTVLVVDDDPDMLAAIELMGRKKLIQIFGATDEESAMVRARIDGKRLDGVILDIGLGEGENAFEIAAHLRSLEGLAELPVAFMSADTSVPNRVAAAHAGATRFLKKPLAAQELVDAVYAFSAARVATAAKVLLVDDDDHFREHVSAILGQEGMEVTSLGDPHLVMDVLQKTTPDILLLDVRMPTISGFDVCRMLRASEYKEMPILFLTAESDPASRLECFRAGGDDYIEKPVIREELLARIGVRMERIRLFKERADRDALTSLPTRRAFLDQFALRAADGQRYKRPVSLCIIDLDKFKDVNDTYGHLAGDRVLMGMGKLLSSRFRTVDVRGRWGGEEFAVAFYGEDAQTAKMILGRVLAEFRQLVFEGDRGDKFKATFSAGVATFPGDGNTFESLFRAADERLYRAKEAGRNRIEI
jgi:diguanylate cyclase (GGDEF)-like protein